MTMIGSATHELNSAPLRRQREQYVAKGISTATTIVRRAHGAVVEDIDGRSFIDFVGGIGSLNVGHQTQSVLTAVREQIELYMHQCFIISLYEPYIEVCRRLAELSPCTGSQKSLLVNSGAEAIENAVKAARIATGRGGVLVFDRAFHGRTLLTLTMSSRLTPFKRNVGPLAPEVYRAAAPYEFRGISIEGAIQDIERLFLTTVAPDSLACVVIEPVQGEGGIIPMPSSFMQYLRNLCNAHGIALIVDEVQCGMGRTGAVWAVNHVGVRPDLLVAGKSLGGGLPLASVTGNADILDAVPAGGFGGTFGGNPVSCAAALAVLAEVSSDRFAERARAVAHIICDRLEEFARTSSVVGQVRGIGPMLGVELVSPDGNGSPAGDVAATAQATARQNGLLISRCGTWDNVLRILVPLAISDQELTHGIDILCGSIEIAEGRRLQTEREE